MAKSLIMLACLAVALAGTDGTTERGDAVRTAGAEHKYKNRLMTEASPYLLQHAHNPVDWYPWGSEPFERAKREGKPIFLSIGYSTCHWCHVMERESFEDEETSRILNDNFICIKVDREQRPDVDSAYITAVQLMTGHGGWPLSVFLTPTGQPFYGGTYFPPEDSYARPSFRRVLLAIAKTWKESRQELLNSAQKMTQLLAESSQQAEPEKLSPKILEKAYSHLQGIFDNAHGGFGRAPKFPEPTTLSLLLAYWHRTGETKALQMVEATLDAMAKGGIYDHIGGGFHRYSTDEQWLVPHFEKMLCDQALLSRAYLQAYQATGETHYARVAKEIIEYVLRDMTDARGGFYSAEDADSEGKEGAFYVWQKSQIQQLLAKESAGIFNEYYGVTEVGSFERGTNILNVRVSIEQLAKRLNIDVSEVETILAQGRAKLLEQRAKRTRPHLDDKIIAGWNGLMISSFAYAGAALHEQTYIDAAEKAAEFVLKTLRPDGRLMRYYRSGEVVGLAFLDDYAFMTMGLLELCEATFDAKRLTQARELAEQMIELFGEERGGGFFLTGSDAEPLIVRHKPSYDGAVPSGNSIAALALLKLGKLTMDQRFMSRAQDVLRTFSGQLAESPAASSAMLMALDFWLGPTQEIIIAGDAERADIQGMLRLIHSKFLPNAVVLFHPAGQAGEAMEQEVPTLPSYGPTDGQATAYVCENTVCHQPVSSVAELDKILAGIARAK